MLMLLTSDTATFGVQINTQPMFSWHRLHHM